MVDTQENGGVHCVCRSRSSDGYLCPPAQVWTQDLLYWREEFDTRTGLIIAGCHKFASPDLSKLLCKDQSHRPCMTCDSSADTFPCRVQCPCNLTRSQVGPRWPATKRRRVVCSVNLPRRPANYWQPAARSSVFKVQYSDSLALSLLKALANVACQRGMNLLVDQVQQDRISQHVTHSERRL